MRPLTHHDQTAAKSYCSIRVHCGAEDGAFQPRLGRQQGRFDHPRLFRRQPFEQVIDQQQVRRLRKGCRKQTPGQRFGREVGGALFEGRKRRRSLDAFELLRKFGTPAHDRLAQLACDNPRELGEYGCVRTQGPGSRPWKIGDAKTAVRKTRTVDSAVGPEAYCAADAFVVLQRFSQRTQERVVAATDFAEDNDRFPDIDGKRDAVERGPRRRPHAPH